MDNEMLQAIGKMMDEKLNAQRTEMSAMMDEKLDAQRTEMSAMMDEKLEQQKKEILAEVVSQVEPIAKQVDYIANVLEGALHLESELEDRVRKLEEAV